jgi:hypothetical protein
MKHTVTLFLIIAILLAACTPKALTVSDVWARPGIAGGNSAIYFVVDNPAGQDDTLLSASSDVAASVELHQSMMSGDGTMNMQPQESVAIPKGQKVEFKPGGLHVMLIGLQRDLNAGDTFKVTLKFQNAGDTTLDVEVRQTSTTQ